MGSLRFDRQECAPSRWPYLSDRNCRKKVMHAWSVAWLGVLSSRRNLQSSYRDIVRRRRRYDGRICEFVGNIAHHCAVSAPSAALKLFPVLSFIEKPDPATCECFQKYLRSLFLPLIRNLGHSHHDS